MRCMTLSISSMAGRRDDLMDNTNDDEKTDLIIDIVFIGFQCDGG